MSIQKDIRKNQKILNNKISFYETLKEYEKNGENENLKEKIKKYLLKIENWRNKVNEYAKQKYEDIRKKVGLGR